MPSTNKIAHARSLISRLLCNRPTRSQRQAAEESRGLRARPVALAEIDDVAQRCRVLMGLSRYFGGRGREKLPLSLWMNLFLLAQQSGSRSSCAGIYGERNRGTPHWQLGRQPCSLDEAIARYSAEKHRDHVVRFSLDPGWYPIPQLLGSLAAWIPDKAIAGVRQRSNSPAAQVIPHSLRDGSSDLRQCCISFAETWWRRTSRQRG